MKRLQRLLTATLILTSTAVSVLITSATSAAACDCDVPDDDAAFADADVVFAGTVTDLEVDESDQVATWRIAAAEVYKGESVMSQEVLSPAFSASCGLGLEIGTAYLVFASTDAGFPEIELAPGQFAGNLCNGTRPLSDGDPPGSFPDAALPVDAGSAPTATLRAKAEPEGDSSSSSRLLVAAVVVGMVAAAGAAVFHWAAPRVRPPADRHSQGRP